MKRRQFFISALVISLFIGFVGMAYANNANAKSVPEKTAHTAKVQVDKNYGKLPLSFIQNDGQLDEKVKYYERGRGHSTYFTEEGVYLELTHSEQEVGTASKQSAVCHNPIARIAKLGKKLDNPKSSVVSMDIIPNRSSEIVNRKSEIIKLIPHNANKLPEIVTEGMQEGKVNYFIGNDPEKWKTNIPTYGSVLYKDVYENIDIKYYGNNRQMEYDIILKPGADLSQVQLSYEGVEDISITGDGKMEVTLKQGNVIQNKPYCYQEIDGKKVEVEGRFKLINPQLDTPNSELQTPSSQQFAYTFEVTSYDKNYPLYIDPVIVYSTYLGGIGDDQGRSIAVDSFGNAYVTGHTGSSNFPLSSPIQTNFVGRRDIFVTKIDASGSSLVYSTYLGGWDYDYGIDIAVDTSGNVYITGETQSNDFPTVSPIQVSYGGGNDDAFVAKIDASGSNLVYSTYLGGTGYDLGWGIAVDISGNVYILGYTSSTDFPTVSPIQASFAGERDLIVVKIDASGSTLVYSTYLGGTLADIARALAIDISGNVYITGYTYSTDFPTTKNPLYRNNGGESDIFITKINNSGSNLDYSTYLGGSGRDQGHGIAADTSGNAYVTGFTESSDFPTVSPIQGNNGGNYDAFIAKINDLGSGLVYSTYLGGTGYENGNDIVVDTSGKVFITGDTTSTDFPTAFPIQASFAGNVDAIVTMIDSSGSNLLFSDYIGGVSMDRGNSIAVDTSGDVYLTGFTVSTDFPTTLPLQMTYGDNTDAFVTKIETNPDLDADGDGFNSIFHGGTDCDDSDPNIYPGAPEICDGVDNNCDGNIDEGFALTTYYEDGDGDTYGNPDVSQVSCSRPDGYVSDNTDCDDGDSAINPGVTEACDGVDNNCDGNIDEGVLTTYYRDSDGDGYGDPSVSQDACTKPTGYVPDNTDCDDTDPDQRPGQTWYYDSDGDGYGDPDVSLVSCEQPGGYVMSYYVDCDDTDPVLNPDLIWYKDEDGDGYSDGTTKTSCYRIIGYKLESELMSSILIDCDDTAAYLYPGQTFYQDLDGDGYGNPDVSLVQCEWPDGYVFLNTDCDDTDPNEHPNQTWYLDSDGDGYGTSLEPTIIQCEKPDGYVSISSDCDDGDPLEYPGQIWYKDADGDGYSDGTTVTECQRRNGYKLESELTAISGDCDDRIIDGRGINPEATEVCDGVDNNCDGQIDEGLLTTYYQDSDGDGYGNPTVSQDACSQPENYVTDNTDCNDNDPNEYQGQTWYKDADNDNYSDGTETTSCTRPIDYKLLSELSLNPIILADCNDADSAISPAATEVCDGVDNNCDSNIDEGFLNPYWEDNDGDGYGDPASSMVLACSPPAGYVANYTDCDDIDPVINPEATEVCDGVDNNCDGQIDEGLLTTYYQDSDGDGYGNPTVSQDACSQPAGYVTDNTDTCPNDADNDADGDGVCGDVDNCPSSNPNQLDSDGDGVGDACDVFPNDETESSDNDGDGTGDNADPDFTEVGTDVIVEPVDTNPDATSTTTLTFDNVEEAGTTTVTSEEIVFFPPPDGFMLSSIMSYEIVSTADFTGPVSICITYADAGRDGGDDSIEDTYKLFHYEDGQWVDITTSLDTVNNQICGLTTSFSPFAVFVDTEVLMAGGGQSKEVDGFLRYTSPSAKSSSLPVGTTNFDIGIVYGDTIDPPEFQATLNGNIISDDFVPDPGKWETVSIPLEPGRNVLVLKVKGAKASGRMATDTDRLVFVVK